MEIRTYRETDRIDDVSRVYALSWKTAYRGIIPQDYLDALPENRWSPYLLQDRSRLLVAADGETIAGASTYCAARDRAFVGWGELISIYLLPQYYRQGIGTKLFCRAVNELQALGYDKIYLWVLEDNRSARSFYEESGFHWNGDVRTDLIGGKALREVRYVSGTEPA